MHKALSSIPTTTKEKKKKGYLLALHWRESLGLRPPHFLNPKWETMIKCKSLRQNILFMEVKKARIGS
jgi:hypothetical protein